MIYNHKSSKRTRIHGSTKTLFRALFHKPGRNLRPQVAITTTVTLHICYVSTFAPVSSMQSSKRSAHSMFILDLRHSHQRYYEPKDKSRYGRSIAIRTEVAISYHSTFILSFSGLSCPLLYGGRCSSACHKIPGYIDPFCSPENSKGSPHDAGNMKSWRVCQFHCPTTGELTTACYIGL